MGRKWRNKRTINYRAIWEKHYKKKIPKGYHIHHLDGDRNNNSPINLICLKPESHAKVHLGLYYKYNKRRDYASYVLLNRGVAANVKAPRNFKHSEETKRIISEKAKGRPSWNKGKKMSAAHYNNNMRRRDEDYYRWSEDRKVKFSETRTGIKMKSAKPFYLYGKRYRTLEDCKKETNRSSTYIVRRLNDVEIKDCYYE